MKADELAVSLGVGLVLILLARSGKLDALARRAGQVLDELAGAPAVELDQAARESWAYERMRQVIEKARAPQ